MGMSRIVVKKRFNIQGSGEGANICKSLNGKIYYENKIRRAEPFIILRSPAIHKVKSDTLKLSHQIFDLTVALFLFSSSKR